MRARRGGFALGLAILVLSVVFLLGLAYAARTRSQLANTTRTVASLQASYLAEGGVQYTLDRLERVRLPFQDTLAFSTGTVIVSAEDAGGGVRRIVSQGRAGSVSHTLRLSVEGNGRILSWRETVQ